MFSRTLNRAVGALFAVSALAATPALAADAWKPAKPVRLLVGFAPGGSADTLARLLADPLSQRLGQPVVVENLAGAGGNIMAYRLSQSPADGYAIGIGAAGSMAVVIVALVVQQGVQQHWLGSLCARELQARFVVEQYWPAQALSSGELRQGPGTCHWRLQLGSTGVRNLRGGELRLFADRDEREPLGQYRLFLVRP